MGARTKEIILLFETIWILQSVRVAAVTTLILPAYIARQIRKSIPLLTHAMETILYLSKIICRRGDIK